MSYQLTVEEWPGYVHAKVVGERTVGNLIRFLDEAYAACMKSDRTAVLLEMQLSGPSLGTTSVYEVISQRVPEGLKLDRIAYARPLVDDPAMAHFARLVAVNRGVNVRLFPTVAAATQWLSLPQEDRPRNA